MAADSKTQIFQGKKVSQDQIVRIPSSDEFAHLEAIVGHRFADRSYLHLAMTHPSALDELPSCMQSYERLEFLGDSVLGFIIADLLYQSFPKMDEGKLTRMKVSLVSGKSLSMVAESLKLQDYIVFGSSESGTHARGLHSALENVFEALVGALLLDGGIEAARRFVYSSLKPQVKEELSVIPESPKSFLQEHIQKNSRSLPEYLCIEQTGPAHDPHFVVAVYFEGEELGRGGGGSKKLAENEAALDALRRLGLLEEV